MSSRVFQMHHLSALVVGAFAGIAIAVPGGAADWSRSFVHATGADERSELAQPLRWAAPLAAAAERSGIQAGFDRDYGDLVLGGSFQQGHAPGHAALGADARSQQIQLHAGLDFGRTLGYVTLGERQTGAEEQRNQVVGFGVRVSVNRVLQMSGEITHHAPSASATGGEPSDDILSVRAAFRF